MFCLNFHWLSIKLKMGYPFSSYSLWLFSCWLGWSLWLFVKCYMGGYLLLLLLLLLVNLVSGFRLKLMYTSLIVSIRSNLTHLHGFQLLLLLPKFIEIALFICTNKINLLNLTKSSDRLAIVAKGFLKLPNLIKLIKQNSLSLPRNVALGTFSELLIVFST